MSKPRKSHLVLVDRSLNRAIGIKYVIFAAFGLVGVARGIPAFAATGGTLIETIYAGLILIVCSIAAPIAWNGVHEKKELYAGIGVITVILTYVVALIVLAVQGLGSRDSLAVIATALLVLPTWRTFFLFGKVRRGEKLNGS